MVLPAELTVPGPDPVTQGLSRGLKLWCARSEPLYFNWPVFLACCVLLALFLYGFAALAPQIERKAAAGVASALAVAGFADLDVAADGQRIVISGAIAPGGLATAQAIARGALCEGPFGRQWRCAVEVRIRINESGGQRGAPLALGSGAVLAPAEVEGAPAQRLVLMPGGEHHNLRLIKNRDGLRIAGQVPDAATRDRILEAATAAYPAVVDEMTVTRVGPGDGFDWALDRVWPILETLDTGEVIWNAGRMSVVGRALSSQAEAARAAYDSRLYPDRLERFDIEVFEPPRQETACDRAYAEMLERPAIEFMPGTVLLRPAAERYLDRLAVLTDQCPASLAVRGHTDSRGLEPDNLKISRSRAEAVVNALIARGVDPERLSARGFGSSRPAADNSTPRGQRLNRRIEIRRVK